MSGMKFKDAVEEAVKGKAIRCLRWDEDQAVMMGGGSFYWAQPALRGPKITTMRAFIEADDFLNEEWEVISGRPPKDHYHEGMH